MVDTTPPSLAGVPSETTAEASSPAGATVTFTAPTATDLVDGSVAVTCSPASGATFAVGTTEVTCTATDSAGNSAIARFDVVIDDTTRPVLTLPSDQIAEASSPAGATVTWTAPTATDLVDGSVAVTCSPASGATFAVGTTEVTCTATDSAGNPATGNFEVKVVDTTPPSLAGVPSETTAEASSPAGATVTFTAPTATDLVDGSVAVTCSPASGATFAVGTTEVTCTATDSAGTRRLRGSMS